MIEEKTNIELGRAEALVLFELLADYHWEPTLELSRTADRIALVNLSGALQKTLVELFRPDYLELLKAARDKLVEKYGNVE
jgi:hypothetical protein